MWQSGRLEYSHPGFIKGRPDLLSTIRRRLCPQPGAKRKRLQGVGNDYDDDIDNDVFRYDGEAEDGCASQFDKLAADVLLGGSDEEGTCNFQPELMQLQAKVAKLEAQVAMAEYRAVMAEAKAAAVQEAAQVSFGELTQAWAANIASVSRKASRDTQSITPLQKSNTPTAPAQARPPRLSPHRPDPAPIAEA